MLVVTDIFDEEILGLIENNSETIVMTEYFQLSFPSNFLGKTIFIDSLLDDNLLMEIDKECNDLVGDLYQLGESHFSVNNINLIEPGLKNGKEKIYRFLRIKHAIKKLNYFNNYKFIFHDKMMKELNGDYLFKSILSHKIVFKSIIKKTIKSLYLMIFNNIHPPARHKELNIMWYAGSNSTWTLLRKLSEQTNYIFMANQPHIKFNFARNFIFYCTCGSLHLDNYYNIYLNERFIDLINYIYSISAKSEIPHNYLLKSLDIEVDKIKNILLTIQNFLQLKDSLNCVVLNQSVVGYQLVLARLCEEHQVKSVELLHGIPSGNIEVGNTQYIFVIGERDREYFRLNNIDVDKIFITGSPRYDIYRKYEKTRKSDFSCKYFTLIIDTTDFTKAHSTYLDNYILINETIKAISKFPNEKLIIKLHPGQSELETMYFKNTVEEIKRKIACRNQIKIIKNCNLPKLIRKSKAIISHNSSVGVEAILTNTPLIVLDFIKDRKIEFEKFLVGQIVTTHQEYVVAISTYLDGGYNFYNNYKENFYKAKEYFCNISSTNSADKVLEALVEINGHLS